MRTAGRVASRRMLEEAVYEFRDDVGSNALEASVSRLRRALAAAGSPDRDGAGHRLDASVRGGR